MRSQTQRPPARRARTKRRKARGFPVRRALIWLGLALISAYGTIALALLTLRFVDPPTTALQIERRVQAWTTHTPYQKSQSQVKLDQISPDLQHAVIAAEDTRFYRHNGFDWKQIDIALDEDLRDGRSRGASTITQQLVKNLFLTPSRSWIRKGIEFTIVPLAEWILGKRRILEIYLNVVEWGPGVFGAQAAAKRWFSLSAAQLNRQQSIGLASILPAPQRRTPGREPVYAAKINRRMKDLGW